MRPKTAFSLHCYSYLAIRLSQFNIEYLLLYDSKVMFRTCGFEKPGLHFTAWRELSLGSFPSFFPHALRPFLSSLFVSIVNIYMEKIEEAGQRKKPESFKNPYRSLMEIKL